MIPTNSYANERTISRRDHPTTLAGEPGVEREPSAPDPIHMATVFACSRTTAAARVRERIGKRDAGRLHEAILLQDG